MNREHLRDALDSISDKHIAEAAALKKRNYLPYIGALAACLILVFALFFPQQENNTAPITMENKPSVTVSEEAPPVDRFPAEEASPSLPTPDEPAISPDQNHIPGDNSILTEPPQPGTPLPPEPAESSETDPDETEEETDPDETEPPEPETKYSPAKKVCSSER